MLPAIEAQLQQDSAHGLHKGAPGTPSLGDWKSVPLGPIGHLLHKVTLPSLGDFEALLNT